MRGRRPGAHVECDFVFHDPRVHGMTLAQFGLYIKFWCLAVEERSEWLPRSKWTWTRLQRMFNAGHSDIERMARALQDSASDASGRPELIEITEKYIRIFHASMLHSRMEWTVPDGIIDTPREAEICQQNGEHAPIITGSSPDHHGIITGSSPDHHQITAKTSADQREAGPNGNPAENCPWESPISRRPRPRPRPRPDVICDDACDAASSPAAETEEKNKKDFFDIPLELESLSLYVRDERLCQRWPEFYESMKVAYPYLDIMAEVRKAHAWEIANPGRQKKDRCRFLGSWLSRAQDHGGGRRDRPADSGPTGTRPQPSPTIPPGTLLGGATI